MNCSMMYKKIMISVLPFLMIFSLSVSADAQERGDLPAGEILIVYSDHADQSTIQNVYRIVEMLTYEGVQVAFAPALRCSGRLSGYEKIIFYELEDYPRELLEEAGRQEREMLFVGSHFLREYLNKTGQGGTYTICEEQVGTLTYNREAQNGWQSLVPFKELIFLEGEKTYESGLLSVGTKDGYFCAERGAVTHISSGDWSNPLVLTAFISELSRWGAENVQKEEYARYLVFDELYPFQDQEKLLEVVKELAEKNTFFILSVMPVYTHVDYPAMQHFCEVLRYAQDNGGMIFIHAPLNQMESFDVDLMNEALSQAVRAYIDQGVYPMGLQVPENWMTNSQTAEVMSRFRTILVSPDPDEKIEADWDNAAGNLVYRDAHQWIAPATLPGQEMVSDITAYSSAVYLDINEDMDVILEKTEACKNSYVPVKNLWETPHSFYTNMDTMSYQNGNIVINGSWRDKTFVPSEYDENFSYNRNQLQRFSKDLTSENHKLTAAVAFVAVLFVIFIIIARKTNHSRFFYEEEDMDEYWENKR